MSHNLWQKGQKWYFSCIFVPLDGSVFDLKNQYKQIASIQTKFYYFQRR